MPFHPVSCFLLPLHPKGFLLVPDFFTPAELQPVIEATEKLVEDLAKKLLSAGKIGGELKQPVGRVGSDVPSRS